MKIIHFLFHQDVLHSFKEALYSVTNMQFRRQNGNKLEYDSKKQVSAYLAPPKKRYFEIIITTTSSFARSVTAPMLNILYRFHYTALHATGVNHALLWGSPLL